MPLAQPGHEIVLGVGNGITSTASDFGTRLSSSAIGPGKPGPPLGIRGVFYRLLAARQLEAGDSRVPWPAVGGSPGR